MGREMMTEQEAITVLREELMADTGFRARLQQGQAVDEDALGRVRNALTVLEAAWADRECVPKEAVLAMSYVDVTISSSASGHPEREEQLGLLELDLMHRIFRCLGKRGRYDRS